LQQLVAADHRARRFLRREIQRDRGSVGDNGRFEKLPRAIMCSEQLLRPPAQFRLARASAIKIRGTLGRRAAFQRTLEERFILQIGWIHRSPSIFILTNEI